MKTKLLIVAVAVFTLFSCNNGNQKSTDKTTQADSVQTPKEKSERKLVGGWTKSEVTPEVEKAVDFVLQQMNTSAKLDKIVSVKTQIVKGRNYDIDFQLDNGEVWNTIVYVDLDGSMKMTKVATLKK